jgi:hypothetical protein
VFFWFPGAEREVGMKRLSAIIAVFVIMLSGFSASAAESPAELDPAVLKNMPLNQFLAQGKAKIAEMNDFVRQALEALSTARTQNDLEKMKCIETNLEGIKGLLRVSDNNAVALSERVIGQDRAGAEHEFVKISIANGRVLTLMNSIKACGGTETETLFSGEPVVEPLFDSGLPSDYTTSGLTDFCQAMPCNLEPPPSASPFN